MPITKAIIPVAGWGTRRLPITKIIEKSMLPVGNRPLVDYSVQELIAAGVKDIYMVISNVEPCQVKEFYSENRALNDYLLARGKQDRLELAKTLPEDVTIHYVQQDPSSKYGTAVEASGYTDANGQVKLVFRDPAVFEVVATKDLGNLYGDTLIYYREGSSSVTLKPGETVELQVILEDDTLRRSYGIE